MNVLNWERDHVAGNAIVVTLAASASPRGGPAPPIYEIYAIPHRPTGYSYLVEGGSQKKFVAARTVLSASQWCPVQNVQLHSSLP